MGSSLSVLSAADGISAAAPSCVQDSTTLCAKVYDLFGLDWLADNAEALIAKPAKILLIVVIAAIVRLLVNRGIRRLTDSTATGRVPSVLRPWRNRRGRAADRDPVETITARRSQRAAAIGSVLRSFASFVVLGIAVVMVLGELGVNLAPILASAGVIGVALGFGAQNLVKDFIAGIGIILEDQYGVGDVVDLGEASGTVEAVGLRITRLRDAHGVVWYARNGEILRVGNKSQGYAQVVIDMPVAHDTDLERCRTVMQEVADAMYGEPDWSEVLLAPPESLGVESITAEGVTLRLQVRTTNADQWRVGRELRQRLKERFVAEGFRSPVPLLAGAAAVAAGTP
jgi:moderate conductance mechanosensitive channel